MNATTHRRHAPARRTPRDASRSALLLLAPAIGFVLAPQCALAASTAQLEFHAALQHTPDLDKGRESFATCAACHSSDGSGIDDGSVPAIAGQHFQVVVKQLTDFRNDRRWDIRMEHFVDRHHLQGPGEVADVAGYVSSLPRRPTPSFGDGSSLKVGTSLYFRACESCHGPAGEGDADQLRPRLSGQHYGYLVRQIHDTGDGRRPNMAVDHVRLVRAMSLEEINGVADYLSRLRPAAPPAAAPPPAAQ